MSFSLTSVAPADLLSTFTILPRLIPFTFSVDTQLFSSAFNSTSGHQSHSLKHPVRQHLLFSLKFWIYLTLSQVSINETKKSS